MLLTNTDLFNELNNFFDDSFAIRKINQNLSSNHKIENNDNGTKSWKCYGPSAPHYYKDITGSYHPIDLSHTQSLSNSNVGNYTLKSKMYTNFIFFFKVFDIKICNFCITNYLF